MKTTLLWDLISGGSQKWLQVFFSLIIIHVQREVVDPFFFYTRKQIYNWYCAAWKEDTDSADNQIEK